MLPSSTYTTLSTDTNTFYLLYLLTGRVRLLPYIVFISVWLIVVYCPVCFWVWGGGFLGEWGVKDFAGGIVVHTTAGFGALASVFVVGKRSDHSEHHDVEPHNVPFVALGTGLLWFGELNNTLPYTPTHHTFAKQHMCYMLIQDGSDLTLGQLWVQTHRRHMLRWPLKSLPLSLSPHGLRSSGCVEENQVCAFAWIAKCIT